MSWFREITLHQVRESSIQYNKREPKGYQTDRREESDVEANRNLKTLALKAEVVLPQDNRFQDLPEAEWIKEQIVP